MFILDDEVIDFFNVYDVVVLFIWFFLFFDDDVSVLGDKIEVDGIFWIIFK